MGLKAITSLESARSKYFMNSTYMMTRKQESNVYRAPQAKMSLTANSSLELWEKKIFHELDVHHV